MVLEAAARVLSGLLNSEPALLKPELGDFVSDLNPQTVIQQVVESPQRAAAKAGERAGLDPELIRQMNERIHSDNKPVVVAQNVASSDDPYGSKAFAESIVGKVQRRQEKRLAQLEAQEAQLDAERAKRMEEAEKRLGGIGQRLRGLPPRSAN